MLHLQFKPMSMHETNDQVLRTLGNNNGMRSNGLGKPYGLDTWSKQSWLKDFLVEFLSKDHIVI